jgi:hypothetical protein
MSFYLLVLAALLALTMSCSVSSSKDGSNSTGTSSAQTFDPPDTNTPMIVMRKGEGAFGGGSYTLSIFAGGKVHYDPHYTQSMSDVMDGNKAKGSPTPADWNIRTEQFQSLLDAFAKADFLNLKDRYQYVQDGCPTHAEDLPTIELTLNLRDRSKKIEHNLGCMEVNSGAAYPRALKDLEDRIARVALGDHAQ